ncbi:hypothetical protein ACMHYB_06490 [Sorangium sp. So ce1128]
MNGAQICLYVDMKDGSGWQFLAQDARSTVEMYAHDIEHFADVGPEYPEPLVSCEAPISGGRTRAARRATRPRGVLPTLRASSTAYHWSGTTSSSGGIRLG